jgi:hypothetical protein
MLPALATADDFAARLGRALTEGEAIQVAALLVDASTLVRRAAGLSWVDDAEALTDDIPDDVIVITLNAARRAFDNPQGATQKSVDDVSVSYSRASAAGVYLTAEEKSILAGLTGGGQGLWTISTTRGDTDGYDQYLDVVGSEPIVFLPPGAVGS